MCLPSVFGVDAISVSCVCDHCVVCLRSLCRVSRSLCRVFAISVSCVCDQCVVQMHKEVVFEQLK